MQRDPSLFALTRRIASKEIGLFFASPVAYLFLASFAAVTLFVFFWGEAFFARNIADVRPMFEWMPFLLVFLCSTLTMRLWSEERRSGTLEHVLTQPVPLWTFVVGKFLGCLALLAIALAITLPLPLTVGLLGTLDSGPVFAGYLATFLLGAAYLSIGLFVSARADNQIVSLIASAAVCGVFYLIGTPVLTAFFGTAAGEWLRLLGTGSRFEAITRGVIDLRDLYYYLSLIAVFLALNTYGLERERWSRHGDHRHHRRWQQVTLLLIGNALVGNLWLGQLTALRVDATEGNQYSISEATRGYLDRLQEPLLLRGYFSAKTHPLLSPLVPQLRDLMEEYAIAGNGRVQVEFIDPVANPELEEEANQQYAIKPVPFQVADRYQSSIVSSYFDVLVKYGDEYKVLSFEDLIEVKGDSGGDIDVQLRNPEYDLTQTIRSVLNSYQAAGNLFDTVQDSLVFTAYVSADEKLPEALRSFRDSVEDVAERIAAEAKGRFSVRFVDPEANGGVVAQEIADRYGFSPLSTNLFSTERFYFYLTVGRDEQMVQIPLDDMDAASFERNLEAGIKRFARGFTKTVALVAPGAAAAPYPSMETAAFNTLREFLGADVNVVDEDLADGSVGGEADLLLLLAPEGLDEKSVFAVDQFLMRGGTVIAATSPFKASLTSGSLTVQPVSSGLEDWLAQQGLVLDKQLVMDPQNAAFPIPVNRNLGGFTVQDWRMLDYPYFPDLREDGFDATSPLAADLPQLTLAWASPVTVDDMKLAGRSLVRLLSSSSGSWLSDSLDVMPALNPDGSSGFVPEGAQGAQTLAVVVSGQFSSAFAGKESPLQGSTAPAEGADPAATVPSDAVSSVISKSADSARLILIASNDFLNDQILQLLGTAAQGQYENSLQFMANAVDWSLDDSGLLGIRSRGNFNRTLPPLEQGAQMFWEYFNYALAACALALVAVVQRRHRRARLARHAALLAE
ncbi:MAG: Gldg family protein [Pseudohongiellaceae bacterium]|jgi:ABC-2 type transport system permease protein